MADTSLVFNILAKDKASKAFDKLQGTALVAGAAIGAALAGGVASMIEKGNADAVLAAQLGAGPEMAKDFGALSGKIYANNFGENVQEVNNALKGVWQNGLIPEDAADADIQRVTEKVLTLTTTMVEDTDRVSSAVSQMLRTGMAGSAEEAFDILQRGVEQGNNKAQDLLDTFNEYGTQFRKLGLDGTQSMGLISQAIKAGARDSDVAADALKEFSIRAVDGSKLTADGFKMLGLNAKTMGAQIGKGGDSATKGLDTVLDRLRAIKDPVKRSQAAVALFGTQAEDLGDALFAMDPSKAVDTMGQVAGAADKAGNTLSQSAGAKLETFKRKAQMALVDGLAKAIPTIEKTFGFLAKHKDTVIPLTIALTTLAGVVYTIVTAMKVWAAVQTVLNLALWTSPITWIVIAVVALVAVIVLVATKTRFFQTIWAGVWGFMKGVGAWFAGPFANFFKAVWNGIVSGVRSVGRAFSAVWGGIKSGASAAYGAVRNAFNSAKNAVSSAISTAVSTVKGLPKRILNALGNVGSLLYKAGKNIIQGLINGIGDMIGALANKMGSVADKVRGFLPFSPAKEGPLSGAGNPYLSGQSIVDLLAAGIESRLPAVSSASSSMAARVTPAATSGGAAPQGRTVLEIRSGGSRMDELLVEILTRAVRNRGGNVQTVLGTR